MLVKPTDGLVVRDPVTLRQLPPEGIVVPDGDLHWVHPIRDGDVTSEPDPVDAEPSAPSDKGDKE